MEASFVHELLFKTISAYVRHTPVERGRWRLKREVLKSMRGKMLRTGTALVKTRAGISLEVDVNDYVGRELYACGEYEPGVTHVLLNLLKPGDGFVDVGANIGYFTLLARRLVGPRGKVVCFEPAPPINARLRANAARQGYTDIDVRDVALSDRAGTAELHSGPIANAGQTSLRRLPDSPCDYTVTLQRLDDLDLPLAGARLLKMDIEGAEMNALLGMREFLDRHRPALVLEIGDSMLAEFGYSAAKLVAHLAELGYTTGYVIGDNRLTPLPACLPAGSALFNALFLRTGEKLTIPPEFDHPFVDTVGS